MSFLFGGGSSYNPGSPSELNTSYTPVSGAPLTYQNGQWVQNGQPVNPAGGVTPTPNAGGWGATPMSNPNAGQPAPGTPAPQPSSVPSVSQTLMNMALKSAQPTPSNLPAAGAPMPQAPPAQAIGGGSGGNNPGLALLIKALLAKGA